MQKLAQITPEEGVKVYQYIGDMLVGGSDENLVGQTQTKIIGHLENLGLQIPASEVKFLGIWWKGGMVCILPEALSTLEQIKMP